MKLVVAIVEADLAHDIGKLLAVKKIRSTKISSMGGVLKRENVTLMIGCSNEQVPGVLKILKDISENRMKKPEDIKSYNANVFVLDLEGSNKY